MEETRPVNFKKISEAELHFYYNRDARLAKASPRVRALYEGTPQRRFAFFSSLTDSKPKALLFTSIVVMCLMILFITYLVPDAAPRFAGNAISISVMRYDGASFVVLKKKAMRRTALKGIIDVSIMRPGVENTVISSRQIVLTSDAEEEFRWNIPGDAPELIFYLHAEKEMAQYHIAAQ